mmetsp:Transcript_111370/g.309617  ORF Transcript_111370/g.309617 Transcript_111370/m.309617 type:complete len:341 (-) Transcript_111370:107-1129(-)
MRATLGELRRSFAGSEAPKRPRRRASSGAVLFSVRPRQVREALVQLLPAVVPLAVDDVAMVVAHGAGGHRGDLGLVPRQLHEVCPLDAALAQGLRLLRNHRLRLREHLGEVLPTDLGPPVVAVLPVADALGLLQRGVEGHLRVVAMAGDHAVDGVGGVQARLDLGVVGVLGVARLVVVQHARLQGARIGRVGEAPGPQVGVTVRRRQPRVHRCPVGVRERLGGAIHLRAAEHGVRCAIDALGRLARGAGLLRLLARHLLAPLQELHVHGVRNLLVRLRQLVVVVRHLCGAFEAHLGAASGAGSAWGAGEGAQRRQQRQRREERPSEASHPEGARRAPGGG